MVVSSTISEAVTAQATASVSPTTGAVGTIFVVTGAGFQPNTSFTVDILYGPLASVENIVVTTSSTGTILFDIQYNNIYEAGQYQILFPISDNVPDIVYTQTINAIVTVTPTSGSAGTTFVVNGSGLPYSRSYTCDLLFGPSLISLGTVSFTTTATGTMVFSIPYNTTYGAGKYYILFPAMGSYLIPDLIYTQT